MEQTRFPLQGFLVLHRFSQCSAMQDNDLGQSWSTRHSGSVGENATGYIKTHYMREAPQNIESVLTFFTEAIAIPLEWCIACAKFLVVFGLTAGSRNTRVSSAKGHTVFGRVITFLFLLTVLISPAAHLLTAYKRIALQAWRAAAASLVMLYQTHCILATCCTQAWINTFLRYACFGKRTVIILLASI